LIATALDRLEAAFGEPRPGRPRPPLDELVLTILSQSTSDRNRDAAYGALRRRFPTWESVRRAPPGAIERAIRSGGLSRGKSRVIHDALQRIALDHGSLSLDVLKRWPKGRAREYLLGFRGVGEKTAACVLLFACRQPAFPVDTHVERIIRRLGWVDGRATPEAMHALLERHVPPARHYSGHINLITLGRRLCRPRDPACHLCPLRRSCRYARSARSGAAGRVRPRRPKAVAAGPGDGYSVRRAAPSI
jgi:endonuclease-3